MPRYQKPKPVRTAYEKGQHAARLGMSGPPPEGLGSGGKDEWMRGWMATPGRPETGNERHARECAETPLTAEALLKLVWDNINYFGDSYYNPITHPIEERVEAYFKQAKEA